MVDLIVLTGMSCQGKTHIATELNKKCGWYVIHTDWFYHFSGKEGLKWQVGEECEQKSMLIRQQIPLLTPITIIDGSHVGNTKELNIFIRELGARNVYKFAVRSDRHKEWFATKHTQNTNSEFEQISKWYNTIFDLEDVQVVCSSDDVVKLLQEKDVYLSR